MVPLKNILIKSVLSVLLVICQAGTANLSNGKLDDLAITWANTKMAAMTPEEKIGQLLMVQAYSNKDKKHEDEIKKYIRDYHIGGLAFFQGTPEKQVSLTMEYQELSKLPLLIAMDAEWGLGMRLANTISFPRQMTLGAVQDNRLIYEMGKEIGRQLKWIGVHLNFAPVGDLNDIPNNPVIGDRSFGQDKKNVSRKAYAYMKGMQDRGIIACVKHFPGHGSATKDSHLALPTISKTLTEIQSEELFPFRLLFKQGIKSVMVGHLHVPAMDDRPNRPASLSVKIVEETIRQQLQYNGLVITDALGMRGVADYFKPGEIEVEAFLAGNDILTVSQSIPKAHNALLQAFRSGKISESRLNASLFRILVAKFEAGLFFPPELNADGLDKKVNNAKALALKEDLFRNAITYFPGEKGHLPILLPGSKRMATVAIGVGKKTDFHQRISSYSGPEEYFMPLSAPGKEFNRLLPVLKGYDEIVVSLHGMTRDYKSNFGISKQALDFIQSLNQQNNVHIVLFGSPYSLHLLDKSLDILLAYEDDPMVQDMAAQALFGSIAIKGKLPVDGGLDFKLNEGTFLSGARVLSYSKPEKVGLSTDTLAKIDELVQEMIQTGAAPGCQILIAKDGNIVYNKAFGFHTYLKQKPVSSNDIYDLASVTKIMATTLAAMRLYEEGKIDIFRPISDYVDGYIDTSDKADITIIEALTHHSGLKAWIPFYRLTLDTLPNNKVVPSDRFYRHASEDDFNVKVADNLFITKNYADTISKLIYSSPLRENKDYKYSDLGLYMIRDVVEAVTGMPLQEYVQEEFYKPMDLVHTGYNPLERFPKSAVVPTEIDQYFRDQELQGYVHDMGAAMLGGVSGHAGLFSNSRDLAVLMQMLLNKGMYGNQKYFDHKTVYTFSTRYHRSSRRGIGFDLKELDATKTPNMSELAPASTFGHLGFTGTCVFGDPDNNIIYVFLSNRTFPTMNNNKLGSENYRSRIQSIIYHAFVDKL